MKRGTISHVTRRRERPAALRLGPAIHRAREPRVTPDRAAEFLGEQAERLRELRMAMLHHDAQSICGHARTLQAMLWDLSETRCRAHALDVERAARQKDFEMARRACDRLEHAIAQLVASLQAARKTG